MIIGSVTLAGAYAPGNGSILCAGLPQVLQNMDALPNRATLYDRTTYGTPSQRSTAYGLKPITATGGAVLALSGVAIGTDQPYSTGDLVYLDSVPSGSGGVGPSVAVYGSTVTFNLSADNVWMVTLAGNPTLALSGSQRIFKVTIFQDATGGRTVTWFSGIKWAGGSAPTLTSAPGHYDGFIFENMGSGIYLGSIVGQNY